MENRKKVLGWFVVAAMALAIYSFFTPFLATGRYHTYSSTGFELLKLAKEEGGEGFLTVALAGTGLGLFLAWVCASCNYSFLFPMLLSIISAGSVWIYFSEAMDYVTNGFWMFLTSHAVSVVLCGIICATTQPVGKTDTAVPVQQTSASAEKNQFCPECGTKLTSSAKFCPQCGTPRRINADNPAPES